MIATRIQRIILVAVGTVIILIPAFINGFPFVYSDTGTYVLSAFTGYIPYDRPYWYGPFVRIASLGGISLWGVAWTQSLLCSMYLFRVTALLAEPVRVARTFLLVCVVLTLATGLGWYAARLIPDIFTGIGLLAMYTLLHPATTRPGRLLDLAVIVAACWFHSSNLLILPMAGIVVLLLEVRGQARPRRMAWLALVVLLAWGGAALANFAIDGKAYVTRNSHVFLMGRMLDTGMLKPYLDERCPTTRFGICQYRDSLPERSEHFLWKDHSPLAKQGGWDATKEEYEQIVRGSFVRPKYLFWHVRGSLASTAEQLVAWEICHSMRSTWYRTPSSPPRAMIADHMPHELPRYMGAMQHGGRGELDMFWPDMLYRICLALSLFLAAWWYWRARRNGLFTERHRFLTYAILTIVLAAWVCASLSVVDTRYLGRDSWLLPFAVMLMWARPSTGPRP